TTRYRYIQAENGIRESHVTGVQTCALPSCDERIEWVALPSRDATPPQVAVTNVAARSSARPEGIPTTRRARAGPACGSGHNRSKIGRASCRERGEIAGHCIHVQYRLSGDIV